MRKYFILLAVMVSASKITYSQQYSVDIPNASSVYEQQTQSNWCWAACNVMLLRAAGISETQETQVVKLFGSLINKGAGENYESAKLALGGTYSTSSGNSLVILPYVSYGSNSDPLVIIQHLKAGIPLVMATPYHGRICVGVDYTVNGQLYTIVKLRLLNPAHSSAIEEVTMQQFNQQGLIGFMTYNIQ